MPKKQRAYWGWPGRLLSFSLPHCTCVEQPGGNRQHRKEEPAGYGDQTGAWARSGISLGSETPALGCFSGELENFLCVNKICLVEKDITIRESCFFQPTEPKGSQQLKKKKKGE